MGNMNAAISLDGSGMLSAIVIGRWSDWVR